MKTDRNYKIRKTQRPQEIHPRYIPEICTTNTLTLWYNLGEVMQKETSNKQVFNLWFHTEEEAKNLIDNYEKSCVERFADYTVEVIDYNPKK